MTQESVNRAVESMQKREPFRVEFRARSGKYRVVLSGVPGFDGRRGNMPVDIHDAYREMRDRIVYTVLSYNTPIAYVSNDGTVAFPEVRYSLTTTEHQRFVSWAYALKFPFETSIKVDSSTGPRDGW